MIVALAIITFVPETVLWLPRLLGLPGLSERGKRMTKPIYVLNGPNLNRLGTREPEIYGRTTLAEIEAMCREAAPGPSDRVPAVEPRSRDHRLDHEAIDQGGGIVINPAAFTFTSIAILDALKMFRISYI